MKLDMFVIHLDACGRHTLNRWAAKHTELDMLISSVTGLNTRSGHHLSIDDKYGSLWTSRDKYHRPACGVLL